MQHQVSQAKKRFVKLENMSLTVIQARMENELDPEIPPNWVYVLTGKRIKTLTQTVARAERLRQT